LQFVANVWYISENIAKSWPETQQGRIILERRKCLRQDAVFQIIAELSLFRKPQSVFEKKKKIDGTFSAFRFLGTVVFRFQLF